MTIQLAVRFLGSLLFLSFYSGWGALVALTLCTGLMMAIKRFDQRLIPLMGTVNNREHYLSAGLFDYIGNIVTVLTLRLQRRTQWEVRRRFLAMRHPLWGEISLNEMKWFIVNMVLIFMQAGQVVGYIVLTLWQGRELNLGAVVAIFQYQLMINQIFFMGMMTAEQVVRAKVDYRSVRPLEEDYARYAQPGPEEKPLEWQRIDIHHLSFAHQGGKGREGGLRNVSLSIHAGQNIALIGASGSGKTTLLALLRGLYEAKQVVLTVDATAFDTLKPLSALSTLIPQDPEIFENTVRYNLTLGLDLPEASVREAMRIAVFDEVAANLPEGVDTDIRERGVNLSGGQKQRLAMARGVLAARDSSLLLLDEPTSSVDVSTESAIFDRLFAATPDKAVVASVHRLHLLPRFDWVCLVQNGEIVQQGTFQTLSQTQGPFQTLWRRHLSLSGSRSA